MLRLTICTIFLIIFCSAAFPQQLKLSKTQIQDLGEISFTIPLSNQEKMIEAQRRFVNSKYFSTGKTKVNLVAGERVIAYTGNVVFKSKEIDNEGWRYSRMVNNSEEASIGAPQIIILDELGNSLLVGLVESDATHFIFLTPDFKRKLVYRPHYEFKYWNYTSNSKFTAIATEEDHYSKTYKLARSTSAGELLIEKEFDQAEYTPGEITIDNEGTTLLLRAKENPRSKVIRYDNQLCEVWSIVTAFPAMYGGMTISETTNSLLLRTPSDLKCIDYKTGKERWSLSLSNLAPDKLHGWDSDFVLNDQYVALTVGYYDSVTNKISNNQLLLFSRDTGRQVYAEKLGNTSDKVMVIHANEGFAILKDRDITYYKVANP